MNVSRELLALLAIAAAAVPVAALVASPVALLPTSDWGYWGDLIEPVASAAAYLLTVAAMYTNLPESLRWSP